MSIEISQRVWKHSKQYGSNKLVLLVLADHANSDGYCYPGVERIAEWAQVEDRQARRIIHEIEAHGELYIHIGGGRAGTNQYLITVDMDCLSMVNALVRYFKMERTDAEKAALTISAARERPNPKPLRRTKNPVLQDEDESEDTVNDDTLSCETPPLVLQDQNPVLERVNPVPQTKRIIINRQLTPKEPSVSEPFSKSEIQSEIKALFRVHAEFDWAWLDALELEIPDTALHLETARRIANIGKPNAPFDHVAYSRALRHTLARTQKRAFAQAGAP